MVMRALGEPSGLEAVELPEPLPGPGQIAIDVEAIGCNFADVLICRGKYQLKPELPFAPGAEVAGRVRAIGPDVSASFALGQPVSAQLGYGGYATQVVADVRRVQALPEGVPFADAVALGVAYQTAYLALCDRARVQRGESVLVQAAAGGVGLALVQIAHALGARVIAGAGAQDKLALCRAHGADAGVLTRGEFHERVRELTGGRGADVICESVGGEVLEESLRCIAWNGRLVVLGFSSGEIPAVKLNRVMLKHIALLGLNLGGYHEHAPDVLNAAGAQLFALYRQGTLRPLIHSVRPLAEAATALAELGTRSTSGKLVLVP
jgi:NADPH2:quinone reductase